jgi:hypothetical protein
MYNVDILLLLLFIIISEKKNMEKEIQNKTNRKKEIEVLFIFGFS